MVDEITLKRVPFEEAKRLVFNYIKEHPGCYTGDIILNLGLDPDLVLEVLEALRREGKVV